MKTLKLSILAIIAAMAVCGCEDDNDSDNNDKKEEKEEYKIDARGHDYVDLGLTSGTLWATTNIGSDSPYKSGDFFAWGETTSKTSSSWSNYKYCNGTYKSLTKYNFDSNYGDVDNNFSLDLDDDAAHVNWGGDWVTPSKTQVKELFNECEWQWTSHNDAYGYTIKGRNGNHIFLPTMGYYSSDRPIYPMHGGYWTSSLYISKPWTAFIMTFYFKGYSTTWEYRYIRKNIRPVITPKETSKQKGKDAEE